MRLTFNTCDVTGELASKAFMRWGREKQNRGIKISRHGIKSEPPRRMKSREKSLTVPSFDTVRALTRWSRYQ